MTTISTTKPRSDTLNLRVAAAEPNLIDRAAQSASKTRTDFILDAVRRAAEEELLDRALMAVIPEAHTAFLTLLDQPPQLNKRLRRTMQDKIPWKTACAACPGPRNRSTPTTPSSASTAGWRR